MATKKIFIVEDEILLLCELEDLILQLGYEVAGTASSVDIALSRLADGPVPDLAILDLNLNGAPSEPVADYLIAAGVPVIFVSGYGSSGLSERYSGADVLQKPYNDVALAEALERALTLKA
ncbi:MAG: response regulator [Hyphomonas sp.]